MKHLILFGLLGSLMTSACGGAAVQAPRTAKLDSLAARVCEGPITIRAAADVRSVGENCDVIDGDLRVIGTSLTSLDGLEKVRSLRYLIVAENQLLENVHGLRGLHSARGVTFIGNPLLATLSGLEGLSKLEGVVVASNGVTSLDGLENVRSVSELVITENPHLESVGRLMTLESVEEFDVERNGPGTEQAERFSRAAVVTGVPSGTDG